MENMEIGGGLFTVIISPLIYANSYQLQIYYQFFEGAIDVKKMDGPYVLNIHIVENPYC